MSKTFFFRLGEGFNPWDTHSLNTPLVSGEENRKYENILLLLLLGHHFKGFRVKYVSIIFRFF